MAVTANDIDRTLRTIFKRCVTCPTTNPTCPTCDDGKVCSLIPQSCSACASMECIVDATSGSGSGSSQHGSGGNGPNVGAIAGGVVGGVVLVALATFAVWWFFVRGKHQEYEEEWEEEDDVSAQKHAQFNMQRGERTSVHTVNSVATSLLSRASNMIPIAYIPGVMNRDGRSSTLHAPPVPPIPAARGPSPLRGSGSNNNNSSGDILFFKPGDLRDSTYSDASFDNRSTFYGRPSITPSLARSSMATYRDDAVINPMPAQTIVRGKANMVSVSTSNKASPLETPQQELAGLEFDKTNGVTYGKPTLLTLAKKSKNGRFPVRSATDASTNSNRPKKSSPLAEVSDASDSEEDTNATAAPKDPKQKLQEAREDLLNHSPLFSPSVLHQAEASSPAGASSPELQHQTPFSDDADADADADEASWQQPVGFRRGMREHPRGSNALSDILEEATKRASSATTLAGRGGSSGGPAAVRESVRESLAKASTTSPFGDEHEVLK